MSTTEHTFLVAVTIEADEGWHRSQVERGLHKVLPAPGTDLAQVDMRVESWWIAEDDRQDGSDCDSAVFVTKGDQKNASIELYESGASAYVNIRPTGDATSPQPQPQPYSKVQMLDRVGSLSSAIAESCDQIGHGIDTVHSEYLYALAERCCIVSDIDTEHTGAVVGLFRAMLAND